ncbi:unnamed protein product [Pylaiella littoralis]
MGDPGGGGGGGVVGAACDESSVPWGPARSKVEASHSQSSTSLDDYDREWMEELRSVTQGNRRDNRQLLDQIQVVGDKIDNIAVNDLYGKLTTSMKLLLEYEENPRHHTADLTIKQAAEMANVVYTNQKSLVLNFSALRIRIVITYLHCPKLSRGVEPTLEDRANDKEQCEMYIKNALKQAPLANLCQSFVASRDSSDARHRARLDHEAMMVFDIILEIITSVYMLEPFRPSEGLLPKKTPDIVIHALSAYCQEGLGASQMYTEVAQAMKNWQPSPERQEKWVLQCLYESTNGQGWACNLGWDNLFHGNLSDLFGVSTEDGRVTKISLGANNLIGTLPPLLGKLGRLQELCLPENKLHGKIPATLWDLPCLRVVALQGNSFTATPPTRFIPACAGSSTGGPSSQEEPRRQLGVAGTVEPCHPSRLHVYGEDWFPCSWKISNTGGIGGADCVMVNRLDPGEEQTVTVMQQAPKYGTCYQDKWVLIGEGGLDFANQPESSSPLINVGRRCERGRAGRENLDGPTLANAVFVAAAHRRNSSAQSSSSYSSNSGRYFNMPGNSQHSSSSSHSAYHSNRY